MELTPFQFHEIFPNLFVYRGAVNTAILKSGERAVLIDPDATLAPERLAEIGIHSVERIYCTQHRRPNTAGIRAFLNDGKQDHQAKVFAPQGERRQFEEATAYWQDWRNRWHLYHCRPGPLAPLEDIPLDATVCQGEAFIWGGFTIHVLETPGMTDGAVSYIVELTTAVNEAQSKSHRVVFSGDLLYGPGQVWDVHSLQKNMGAWSDYHGFLGATRMLVNSLEKLAETRADCLVPSHGQIITGHPAAARLTIQRLEQLYRNYAAVSSLNFYFPNMLAELSDDPWRMEPSETFDFPDFIRFVASTSFAIHSESGALFLIDCGSDSALETLAAWKEQGLYTELEGCWVTHYHDDHVDALHHLATMTNTPIYADAHLVEILEHPSRFILPCISPTITPVTHVTTHSETWQWHEFELTALHFPGQTHYHGGLLVRGHGKTVLLCGDSFSPAGLDDYTAGNRNFLGAGVGFRRCIDLVRQYRPDLILNQHQQQAFCFSSEQLDYMEKMLVDREALLRDLLPWDHPNFGTDEGWIRVYPYEVEACPGGSFQVEVRATNHAPHPGGSDWVENHATNHAPHPGESDRVENHATNHAPHPGGSDRVENHATNHAPHPVSLNARAVLPEGWASQVQPPMTRWINGDEQVECVPISITIPPGINPGIQPLAFGVTWGDRYLGQVCHCLVRIR